MSEKTFTTVASVIFVFVALIQVLRVFYGWPVAIGGWSVPMWISWVIVVIAGALSYLGISLAMRK
jgi:hypothetical protein